MLNISRPVIVVVILRITTIEQNIIVYKALKGCTKTLSGGLATTKFGVKQHVYCVNIAQPSKHVKSNHCRPASESPSEWRSAGGSNLHMILCKKANNKGADQTAWMRRLVCASVVRKPPKTGFLASRPILISLKLVIRAVI